MGIGGIAQFHFSGVILNAGNGLLEDRPMNITGIPHFSDAIAIPAQQFRIGDASQP